MKSPNSLLSRFGLAVASALILFGLSGTVFARVPQWCRPKIKAITQGGQTVYQYESGCPTFYRCPDNSMCHEVDMGLNTFRCTCDDETHSCVLKWTLIGGGNCTVSCIDTCDTSQCPSTVDGQNYVYCAVCPDP